VKGIRHGELSNLDDARSCGPHRKKSAFGPERTEASGMAPVAIEENESEKQVGKVG
jgi:hypothetical protein